MARASTFAGGDWVMMKDWAEQEHGPAHTSHDVSQRSAPEQAAARLRIVRSAATNCLEVFRQEVVQARQHPGGGGATGRAPTVAGAGVGSRSLEQIEIDTLRARLMELEAIVAGLQRRAEGQIHEDPAHTWIREHPEVAEMYRGQHVAIHPMKGVVVSGQDLGEVIAEARKMGILDMVEFDYFPEP